MFNHESAMKPTRKRSSPVQQTVAAVSIPDARLKVKTVIEVTGLSESSIYRKVAAGNFPTPIKDGTRCTRWRAGDITNWLQSRGEATPA